MKSHLKISLFLLSIPILISGCGPVLYSNVGQNVPLLQEQGEFSGQISYSSSDAAWYANGIGIQGAYAISDKVAAIGSFYSLKGNDPYADEEWEGNGSYFEFGAGMYGGKEEKMFLYEVFLGIGSGSIKNESLINQGEYINVKYLKPFIQPSFAFSTQYFDLALTPRIAYLTYSDKDSFYFTQNGLPITPDIYFEENDNKILFEPGIMLRGGFPGVKLEIQYNYSTINGSIEDNSLANKDFLSFGVRFLLAERVKPKN